MVKIFWNIAGTVFVGLGVLGAILPLLPATPFLLLAAACYVRGSERLYNWLMNNRYLGTYIRNFREGRGMPVRAKVIAITLLWLSLLYSAYRVDIALLRPVLIATGIGVTILILSIKTLREEVDSTYESAVTEE
jgi:uncharacterized membrane protein YbaN (DUF454 family)